MMNIKREFTMIKIIAVMSLMLVSFNLKALDEEKLFVSYCMNFGDTVSSSFESCVNRNFSAVERALEGRAYFSYCMNFGDQVSSSFTSCISRNFNSLRIASGSGFYSECINFDRNRLSTSFVSCVNRNFSEAQRNLSKDLR